MDEDMWTTKPTPARMGPQTGSGGIMTTFEEAPAAVEDSGWFPDPLLQHDLRYFDGGDWTDHVTHRGPEPCWSCHPLADAEADGGKRAAG